MFGLCVVRITSKITFCTIFNFQKKCAHFFRSTQSEISNFNRMTDFSLDDYLAWKIEQQNGPGFESAG